MSDVLLDAWKTVDPSRVGGLPQMAADIRAMCHHVVKAAWEDLGNGNRISLNGFHLGAQAQGWEWRPSMIIVWVARDGESRVEWHRVLYRGEADAALWLQQALLEGHAELLRLAQ